MPSKASLVILVFLTAQGPLAREVYLMGTRAVLTSYSESDDAGRERLESYIRILEGTEAELSVWRSDTPLSRLNAQPVGEGFEAGSRLIALIEELRYWWKESGGTFDPGIGRILDARGFYGRKPSASLPAIHGIAHLRLEPSTGRIFRTADIWMDSGAFGKGEALDRVLGESKRMKDPPWMIDLGGQVMVYGVPPGKAYWTIDIAHPQERNSTALTLRLKSGSISVSGNSEQPGHILDPRTRKPVMFDGSVVVWHERGLIADIVSTALFVMGPDEGLRWAESRGLAACFVMPGGQTVRLRATIAFSKLIK